MSTVIVNVLGLGLIALIVWWFWFSQPGAQRASGAAPVEIVVENGVYEPARIEVPAGEPVTLRFLRKDASACAEKVIFESLGVTEDLPLARSTDITITPPQPGEYEFTCQMQMYRGRLVAIRKA